MPELLTAKDVELKIFKKATLGGYAVPDVEEFLNQVAEDLEAYVLRINDLQRKVYELEDALGKHEAMKDTIKDALILAQKSAKDKEDEANRQAGLILSKAESKMKEFESEARRRQEEAESTADDIVAAARTAAAQVLKSAEEMKEEAQKRLDRLDLDIERRLAEANARASEITGAARLEARRITEKVKRDLEEGRRALDFLVSERINFLGESSDLLAAFDRLLQETRNKTEADNSRREELLRSEVDKVTFAFSSADDAHVSLSSRTEHPYGEE